jgi:hypothetical protein
VSASASSRCRRTQAPPLVELQLGAAVRDWLPHQGAHCHCLLAGCLAALLLAGRHGSQSLSQPARAAACPSSLRRLRAAEGCVGPATSLTPALVLLVAAAVTVAVTCLLLRTTAVHRPMSSSGDRIVVTIDAVKPNYKAAALDGGGPPNELIFVRKSSMRHGPAAWAELGVGDKVELKFKRCAGRPIITDAVKLPSATQPSVGQQRLQRPPQQPHVSRSSGTADEVAQEAAQLLQTCALSTQQRDTWHALCAAVASATPAPSESKQGPPQKLVLLALQAARQRRQSFVDSLNGAQQRDAHHLMDLEKRERKLRLKEEAALFKKQGERSATAPSRGRRAAPDAAARVLTAEQKQVMTRAFWLYQQTRQASHIDSTEWKHARALGGDASPLLREFLTRAGWQQSWSWPRPEGRLLVRMSFCILRIFFFLLLATKPFVLLHSCRQQLMGE